MQNTKTFTAPIIANGVPIPNTKAKYCEYCGSLAFCDEEWDEYTKYGYYYCDCEHAKKEIEFKDLKDKLDKEYQDNLLNLKIKYGQI